MHDTRNICSRPQFSMFEFRNFAKQFRLVHGRTIFSGLRPAERNKRSSGHTNNRRPKRNCVPANTFDRTRTKNNNKKTTNAVFYVRQCWMTFVSRYRLWGPRNVYRIVHTQTDKTHTARERIGTHKQTKIPRFNKVDRRDETTYLFFFIWSAVRSFFPLLTALHSSEARARTHTFICCFCFILVFRFRVFFARLTRPAGDGIVA